MLPNFMREKVIQMSISVSSMVEDAFTLDFYRAVSDAAEWNQVWTDIRGSDGIFVHERIVAPPDSDNSFSQSLDLGGRHHLNMRSMVLNGVAGDQVQYLGIVVRSVGEIAVRRLTNSFLLTSDNLQFLFGGMLCSGEEEGSRAFNTLFSKFGTALSDAGLDESDLVRTWYFLHDISADYQLFNEERDIFFKRRLQSSDRLFPVSTGIEGKAASGSAVAAQFWALRGTGCLVERLTTPLQCEPAEYGVSFSRAMALTFARNRLILVSGTASIDQHGHTVYQDDCPAQIQQTLATVVSLLQQGGASLSDVVYATVFFKDEICRDQGITALKAAQFPLQHSIVQIASICRSDLLCEIEVIAVVANAKPLAKQEQHV